MVGKSPLDSLLHISFHLRFEISKFLLFLCSKIKPYLLIPSEIFYVCFRILFLKQSCAFLIVFILLAHLHCCPKAVHSVYHKTSDKPFPHLKLLIKHEIIEYFFV